MLRKRIVGAIVVRDGWAVQSMGFKKYLPLGRPEILARNLDRWGADEIVLVCLGRTPEIGPDLELLGRLATAGISTPLIYAGGIATPDHAVNAVKAGADRVVVDSLLFDQPEMVRAIEGRLGAQAIIVSLPLSIHNGNLVHFNYRKRTHGELARDVQALMQDRIVSEALIIDHNGDGGVHFDIRLIDQFPNLDLPLIAFGGLAGPDQVREVLTQPRVAAAVVGNSLNYREHAIRLLKQSLGDLPIRVTSFQRRVVS